MRILNELNLSSDFILQDIKEQELTVTQLEAIYKLSGSYESLFSKRAKLYKEMDLKNQKLSEKDYKFYILQHYTFLKRPVIIANNHIFIGNSKFVVETARQFLNEQ